MSNQPDQPHPPAGQPPNVPPPGYYAPAVPPAYQTPQDQGQQFQTPEYQAQQFQAPVNAYGGQNQQYPNPQVPPYGAPTYYQGGPGYTDSTSGSRGLSLTSMILGLTSLFLLGWIIIPQIVGVVLGHMGMRKESPQGRAFAITGLISNYLAVLVWGGLYLFLIFVFAIIGADSYSSY